MTHKDREMMTRFDRRIRSLEKRMTARVTRFGSLNHDPTDATHIQELRIGGGPPDLGPVLFYDPLQVPAAGGIPELRIDHGGDISTGGTRLGGSFDSVVNWASEVVNSGPLVSTGPQTNQVLLRFGFPGTDKYPAGETDAAFLVVTSSGVSINTLDLYDLTTGQTLATVSIPAASGIGVIDFDAFVNVPAGEVYMQLRATSVAAGDVVTVDSLDWYRHV